jgi:phage terminase large subunit
LLLSEIDRLEMTGFTSTENTIRHRSGGEFTFKGLARNPDAVKSMEGYDIFWVEEAQSVSQESLTMLTPTLRKEKSEVWFSMNPMSSADPMSKRFLEPFMDKLVKHGRYEDDLHLIVWCNYTDNPWFPDVLEKERQWDYEHLTRAEYDHIWLGAYNDTVENAIIQAEWFDAAIDAHIKLGFKPQGIKVASHDPSDKGPDPKGSAIRHGSVILRVSENPTGDANEGMDWATSEAIEHNVDCFVWDCDGLGASLRRQALDALDGKKIDTIEYKGSESVDDPEKPYQPHDSNKKARTNKETFKNKRAQKTWNVRDRFYNTWLAVEKGQYIDPDQLISICSAGVENMAKLRSEACRIPRKPNAAGYIQIMSKDEMRAIGIPSPNMFDSIVMAYGSGRPPAAPVELTFTSLYS